MKAITTLLFFALYFSTLHAQESLKHEVYFASDKHEISESELTKLKSFLRSLEASFIASIQLTGHTDSDADEEYNIELSDRRVQSVQEVIATFDLSTRPIDSKFYGESKPVDENTHPEGKQNNRRVEIVAIPMRIEVPPPPKQTPDFVLQLPEIEGDTMITFPQGTILTLPKKDYYKNPNCISMTEYTDGESVRADGLTTMTSDGDPLISGGMFDLKLCDEKKSVKILVPVRTVCGKELPFTVWAADSSGNWAGGYKTKPAPILTIDGKRFYEIELRGSQKINLDVPQLNPFQRGYETTIKLKNGYTIVKIQIASDEPMIVENPFEQTEQKATFLRICTCSTPLLYLEAINRNGDTTVIDFAELNDFKKRGPYGQCMTRKTARKNPYSRIPRNTKYRKYFIRKSDFLNET